MSGFITRNLELVHLVKTALTVSNNACLKQVAYRNIHATLKSFYNYAYCFMILFLILSSTTKTKEVTIKNQR